MNHIRECLPNLKLSVNKLLSETKSKLAAIGDSNTDQNKPALLLQVLNNFTNSYCNAINGSLTDTTATIELYGGARINYIFNDIFGKYIDNIDSKGGLTTQEIHITISNSTGTKTSLFLPEDSFEQLVKRQIKFLEEPSLKCVDLVYEELKRIVNTIDIVELTRFKRLQEKMFNVVYELLKHSRKPTKNMIKGLISIEMSFINTNHPDFIGGGDAITKILQKRAQRQNNIPPPLPQKPPEPDKKKDKDRERKEREKRERDEREKRDREDRERREREEREKRDRDEKDKRERDKKDKKKNKDNLFSQWFGGNKNTEEKTNTNNNDQEKPITMTKVNEEKPKERVKEFDKIPDVVYPENQSLDENTEFQVELLELLLKSYFSIVRKNIKDKIPKSIMYFLVNRSMSDMQSELVKQLYKEDLFDVLLEENEEVSKQRLELIENIKILTDATKILSETIEYRI